MARAVGDFWNDAAAWVQAVGTIAAVVGAAWVARGESAAARKREELARREAAEREQRGLQEARKAAFNLAILAATHIRQLHTLLRDETRRGRVTRVSPSRTLETNERLLTAFPIQSLGDADAMVAFAYFPGALSTAAEVYAHLEEAVRAAPPRDHVAIFADYAGQMARLDRAAHERLNELRVALGLPPTASHHLPAAPHGEPRPAELTGDHASV